MVSSGIVLEWFIILRPNTQPRTIMAHYRTAPLMYPLSTVAHCKTIGVSLNTVVSFNIAARSATAASFSPVTSRSVACKLNTVVGPNSEAHHFLAGTSNSTINFLPHDP